MLEGNGHGRLCHFGRTRHNFEWYGTNCGYTLYLVRTATPRIAMPMNSVDCEGREGKRVQVYGVGSICSGLRSHSVWCTFSDTDTLNFRLFLFNLVRYANRLQAHLWEWEERCDYEAHFGSPSNATHDDIDNDDEPTPKMFCPVPPNLWRVNPTRDFSVVVDLSRPYGR